MSNSSLESTGHKEVERAPEKGASSDVASSAYGREALADLHKNPAPNTADQHLSAATISKDQISFGASSGCSSGDLGLKIHDNMPVMNGGDKNNGLRIHDNMPVSSGGTDNKVKLHDDMIVSNGDADHVHKLPPGQDSCGVGPANSPDAAKMGANDAGATRVADAGKEPADKHRDSATRVQGAEKQPADPYRDSGAPSGEQRATDCSGTSFQSSANNGHGHADAPAHPHAHSPAHNSHSEGHSHTHAHAHKSHTEEHGHAHARHEHSQATHEHVSHREVGAHQSARRGSGVAGHLDEKISNCGS